MPISFVFAPVTMDLSGQPMSAAQWRKQRRLHLWWRHEQQSIAAALATFTHHSAQRQKTARAAGEVRVEPQGEVPEELLSQSELFELFGKEPGGARPDRLAGVRPQDPVQRHTVEQIDDSAPDVSSFDVPEPLMVEQPVDVLQFFDALVPVAEQIIDVPKIIIERIPPRTSVREPQLAEQLVEVPTILYFLKQEVDIPVPGGGGRLAGLQGFLPSTEINSAGLSADR